MSLQKKIIAATLGSEPSSRNRWERWGGAFRRALALCCPPKGRGEEQGGPEVGSPLSRGLCAPNTRHSWPSGSRGGNSSRATLPSEEPPKKASPGRPLWAFLCPPRCGAGQGGSSGSALIHRQPATLRTPHAYGLYCLRN